MECKYKVSKGMLEHFWCCIGQIIIEDIKKPFLLTDQLQYILKITYEQSEFQYVTHFFTKQFSVIHIS